MLRVMGFALLLALSMVAPARAQLASVTAPEFTAYVDGVAHGLMEAQGVPGLATIIVTPDGTVARTYGVGATIDGAPEALDPARSMFPIASISKAFVAVALMRAVEQGLIDLDAPANQYLDFELPTYRGAREITVRDLARHESGMEERWLATGAGGDAPDPRPWGRILSETQPRLIARPGAYASYSNYGAALLAYIVERAAGKPYYDYLQEQVFAPLGMNSSAIESPAPDALTPFADRIVYGWSVSGRVVRPGDHYDNVRTYPAGRMMLSLADAGAFMRMLLNHGLTPGGSRFLSEASVNELLTPSHRVHPRMTGIGVLFAEKDVNGRRYVGHGGDGDTHHTDLILSRELGVGIFVVFLSAPGPEARDYFTRAVLGELTPTGAFQPPATPETAADLSQYAGAYRHYRWAFTSIEKVLQLSSEFAVRESGAGTLIVTGRLSPGEYAPAGADGLFQHRRSGEYLYFWRDADGRMNLTQGNFAFVTAFQLNDLETQAFNGVAYWGFVISLSLLGGAAIIVGVRAALAGARARALGFVVLATALLACGVGFWTFVSVALSMSEAAVQHAIPTIAYWLLAIPPAAAFVIALYLIMAAFGPLRPRTTAEYATATASVAALGLFFVYLTQWNAFGWNFP